MNKTLLMLTPLLGALFWAFVPFAGAEVDPAPERSPYYKPPADTVFIEAESMKRDGPAWMVRKFAVEDGYYGYPSGLKLLQGKPGATDTAAIQFAVPHDGKYRIWIRGLNYQPAPYRVRLMQNAQAVGQAVFDDKTLCTPEPNDASYKGRAFVWWSLDAQLAHGPCTLQLVGLPAPAGSPGPWVDCFAVTSDLNYSPRIWCFAKPLYLRVVAGPKHNKLGGVLHFEGRIDFEGFLCGRGEITRQGYADIGGGYSEPAKTFLFPGIASEWMNLGPTLDPRGVNHLRFDMQASYAVDLPDSDYTLELARSPGGKPIYRGHREGSGSGLVLLIDPRHPEDTKSNIDWSAIRLRQALDTPAPANGRPPTIFPSFTGLNDYDISDPEPAIQNDLLTLRALGFTGSTAVYHNPKWMLDHGMIYSLLSSFVFSFVKEPGCLSEPNTDGMRDSFIESIKTFYTTMPHLFFIRLMDEIDSMDVTDMKKSKVTTDQFRDYLRAKGLQPVDLLGHAPDAGKDPWESIQCTEDEKTSPKLFYYTQTFREQILVDFLKAATGVLQQVMPGLATTANDAGEFYWNRDGVARGTDIFQIYKADALTYGYTEDANSAWPSGQTSSFMMDCLRSACKYNHQPYAAYSMSDMPPWDDETKVFAELGHGAQFVHLYDYGPYHSDSSDPVSQWAKQLFPAWKEMNYAIGSVEDDLYGAQVIPSRVALLYSSTTDVWNVNEDHTGSGSERLYLYLLLRHLGYSIDILTEDDVLEGRTSGYDAIFTAESHLKDGVTAKLLDWTKQGGFLYVGAGAGRFNQYNEPVPGFEASGLKLGPFSYDGAGNWPQVMEAVDKIPVGNKMLEAAAGKQPVAPKSDGHVVLQFADGTPCATQLDYGKGHLLYVGFFPGISYIRLANIREVARRAATMTATEPGEIVDTYFASWYPEESRTLMRNLLKPMKVIPPVQIDSYLVEGNLLQGKHGDILALANWSGHSQHIHVKVDLPYSPGQPRAAINSLQDISRDGNCVSFTMTVGPGNFVDLPRSE